MFIYYLDVEIVQAIEFWTAKCTYLYKYPILLTQNLEGYLIGGEGFTIKIPGYITVWLLR